MAAHRYWRVLVTACNGSGYPDVDTFELLAGGVNVATTPSQAYASSSFVYPGLSFDPGNAVAGQAGDWSSGTTAPAWWGYDFGAGAAQDIASVRITNRSNSPNWTTDSPAAVQLQWSEDNAAWTTLVAGTLNWTGPSQVLTITAPTPTPTGATIDAGNAAFVYSPYNWQVTAAVATTWNPGAYVRTLFTGDSCALLFDMSAVVAPISQIWCRIDNGPWTLADVAASVALTVPAKTTANAAVPLHRLEIVVKAIDIGAGANRWSASAAGAVRFRGVMLWAGGTVQAPGRAPLNVLIYGDSITEGARTLGEASSTTVADMDAMFGWAFEQGRLLGAEIGVVGFSGSGYVTSAFGVPAFPGSFGFLAAGIARSFSPSPDLVVVNHGQNDQSANIQVAATGTLNGLLGAVACRVVLLNPLPPGDNAYLQAAVAGCSAPGRAAWVSTAGFFVRSAGSDASQIHPSGPNSAGLIGPRVAGVLRPFLPGAAGAVVARWTH